MKFGAAAGAAAGAAGDEAPVPNNFESQSDIGPLGAEEKGFGGRLAPGPFGFCVGATDIFGVLEFCPATRVTNWLCGDVADEFPVSIYLLLF